MVWAQQESHPFQRLYPLGTFRERRQERRDHFDLHLQQSDDGGSPLRWLFTVGFSYRLTTHSIQPLFNGHEEYYEDYSHGIRMVQQACTVDGAPTTISAVLTNPALAALLSDETTFSGNVIPQPYYTVAATAPAIITQPYSQSVKQGANVAFSSRIGGGRWAIELYLESE